MTVTDTHTHGDHDVDSHVGHDHAHGGNAHTHRGGHDGDRHHGGHGDHVSMFRRRFWWSLLLTIPIVATSPMIMDWFGYDLDFYGIEWVGAVLGTAVFLWGGWPFLAGGVQELTARQPGMMLLIAMAIAVAYAASMATSLEWFDLEFWWELAALITIMLLGHWQEMRALGQASSALQALAELLPDDAERVRPDGTTETITLDGLGAGDVVLVRPGGRVPADGEIVDGEAELDESMVTGESRPVPKVAGDRVVAGTVSTDSSIRVRVTAVGEDTALAGIQRLVAEAQSSHSRAQALADRFAALLFYAAAGAGILTYIAWRILGNPDDAVVRTRHRAGDRLPPRPRPRHSAGDLAVQCAGCTRRDPCQGPARPRTHAHHRRRPVRQDRHPHQGRACRHRRRRRPAHRRRAGSHGRRRGVRQRAPPRPRSVCRRRPCPAARAVPPRTRPAVGPYPDLA